MLYPYHIICLWFIYAMSLSDNLSMVIYVMSLPDNLSMVIYVMSTSDNLSMVIYVISLADNLSMVINVLSLPDNLSMFINVMSLSDNMSMFINVMSLSDNMSMVVNVISPRATCTPHQPMWGFLKTYFFWNFYMSKIRIRMLDDHNLPPEIYISTQRWHVLMHQYHDFSHNNSLHMPICSTLMDNTSSQITNFTI